MTKEPVFEPKELEKFLLTTLSLSLVFFFFKWRTTDLNLATGAALFITTVLFTGIVTFFARFLQKKIAKKLGYEGKFSNTIPGMGISLAISFFSFGLIPLLSPGEVNLEHNPRTSLGKRFSQGVNYRDMSKVAITSIIVYIVFVIILKILFSSTDNELFSYLTMICVMLAFFSVLPIPTFEGIKIFANSRIVYCFMFIFVLTYSVLVLFTKLFIIIIPLFIAIILTAFFFVQIEKGELSG